MRLRMFKALLILLGIIGISHLYYYSTGNFGPESILQSGRYALPVSLPQQTHEDQEKTRALLGQIFSYLGHGHQTFVFLGEDGETILKLFMKEFVDGNRAWGIFPPVYPFRSFMLHRERSHDFRLNRVLSGYSLSYALDKENSGLLYLHIDSDPIIDTLTVVDGLGLTYQISAADVVFALQKRAVTTNKVLGQLLAQGDVEGVKERLHQIRILYQNQFEKGLVDRDRNFLENTGFISDRAIRIDVGKIVEHRGNYPLDHEFYKVFEKRLGRFLQSHYPQFAGAFSHEPIPLKIRTQI